MPRFVLVILAVSRSRDSVHTATVFRHLPRQNPPGHSRSQWAGLATISQGIRSEPLEGLKRLSIQLYASVLVGLVDLGRVEGDHVAVFVRHGSSFDVDLAFLSSDVGRRGSCDEGDKGEDGETHREGLLSVLDTELMKIDESKLSTGDVNEEAGND